MTIYFHACLLLPLFATAGYSKTVTVCDALEHRIQTNGRDVEVVGRIEGTGYHGIFIFDSDKLGPCVDRWLFSWPSRIFLRLERSALAKLDTELDRHPGHAFYGVVKGRLITQSDLFTVNLPWRRDRPLGHHFLGAAALIDVTEIRPQPPPNVTSTPRH